MSNSSLRTRSGHFIPKNAARFLEWINNLVAVVDSRDAASHFGISNADWSKLLLLHQNFAGIQASFPTDATRAMIAGRNEAQRELTAFIRYIIRFYFRRPSVSDQTLLELGIPPIDHVRTMHIDVTEKVDFVLHIRGIRRVIVDFWQLGVTGSMAKPRGYDGAVLIWHISDEMPKEAINFQFHTMASRRPHIIEFNEQDRHKTVWVALAWQNNRGHRGEWSDFKSTVIP